VINKRLFRSCRVILNRIRNRSRTARMRVFKFMSRLSR
jgi:hypothetical protein